MHKGLLTQPPVDPPGPKSNEPSGAQNWSHILGHLKLGRVMRCNLVLIIKGDNGPSLGATAVSIGSDHADCARC